MYFDSNEPKHGDFTVSELVALDSPHMGDKSAPITIIEFGDYQCTYCYKFHKDSLGMIQKEYIDSGKASLVFVDFTLNGPDSVLAVRGGPLCKRAREILANARCHLQKLER